MAVPNQASTDFSPEECQTPLTLGSADNIVFQENVILFVLATKAVSEEDSQMALVIILMKHNCLNLLS